MNDSPLWIPSVEHIAGTNISRFMLEASERSRRNLENYQSLWEWSISDREAFWSLVWDFCGVAGEKGATIVADPGPMPGAEWFPHGRLNFAENLLKQQGDEKALIFWGEEKIKRHLTHDELRVAVSRCRQALIKSGVTEGDRVAGFLPNLPEAVIAMIAATSLGAIWSSASPDFGSEGVMDRFGQIQPKVLFCVDGYFYNGKIVDCMEKNREVSRQLASAEQVVVVPYINRRNDLLDGEEKGINWDAYLSPFDYKEIVFEKFPFSHPLFIMFSSGTTGVPKCIVHSAGGTLLQHLKEHQLHTDIRSGDRLFYFTTCGWMMWNWLVSGLASSATLLLYDGSPFAADKHVLFDFADSEKMTQFGTSAKFIEACSKFELRPAATHRLADLRTLLSTGSPLSPEGFRYVYRKIKADIQLSSIAGGTDIISCFTLGAPMLPVWEGELQCRGLGMAVEVYDEEGNPLREEKGELVCTRSFPSMPIGFWNDNDGKRYKSAYFERYPGIWCHGDFAEITAHGGMIIHGRSDATLNPGGVRIGTAEIYRQVEKMTEVLESLVIGQQWESDVRVVLFVRLREGLQLDDDLVTRIKQQIRSKTTPRHVPARIVRVDDIPRTKSGKIVEIAVRDIVHGNTVKNVGSLANPEALELYRNIPELQT